MIRFSHVNNAILRGANKGTRPGADWLSVVLWIGLLVFSGGLNCSSDVADALDSKTICLDPGHGGTAASDSYRVGPTGEREEWIDLRVALFLRDMLQERKAKVLLTRTEDVDVPLKDRAQLAVDNKADVFLSLHHNATADPNVNFPIIYFHGNASENQASVELGKCVARHFAKALFDDKSPVSLVSDHTIFPTAGTSVLRNSYGIPGVIGEASFFTNPAEEERLKDPDYNSKEAKAYVRALEEFFSKKVPPIKGKYSSGKVEPFEVFQEAERMNEIAKRWKEDFEEGKRLFNEASQDSLRKAYELFTRSAKSFPDSYVARECHQYRARLLRVFGRINEAAMTERRVREFYVEVDLGKGVSPAL